MASSSPFVVDRAAVDAQPGGPLLLENLERWLATGPRQRFLMIPVLGPAARLHPWGTEQGNPPIWGIFFRADVEDFGVVVLTRTGPVRVASLVIH